MKKIILSSLSSTLLCFSAISFTHAAEEATMSKAEMQLQMKVCSKKKQGEWVTYNHKGVTFNGSCEPNENGKLKFTPPMPK